MVEKLAKGVHHFQKDVFASHKELFEKLGEGQSPDALLVTCSDSRVVPSLLMGANPGELFVLRNAGNLVPAYGVPGGEGAAGTVEYAIAVLKIRHVIVCGHSRCGAMTGLLNPEKLEGVPAVRKWLDCAATTKRIIEENYADLEGPARIEAAIEENVLVQLENLRTHPSVAAALSRKELHLHAWFYEFESGEVFAYDSEKEEFVPLAEARTTKRP